MTILTRKANGYLVKCTMLGNGNCLVTVHNSNGQRVYDFETASFDRAIRNFHKVVQCYCKQK
jgi:hypothetical protein